MVTLVMKTYSNSTIRWTMASLKDAQERASNFSSMVVKDYKILDENQEVIFEVKHGLDGHQPSPTREEMLRMLPSLRLKGD